MCLLAILAVQTGLSMRLMWSNTAFTDEALYLWSGHWEIAHLLYGMPIPRFQANFSGAPVIYPIIGAIADSYGGLTGARLLSLGFMLGATVLLCATTGRLFGRTAGVAAAAVFAAIGPGQALGVFATYDTMAVFLLAVASWLAVRASGRAAELLLIASALAMALADATKYATLLWDPIVIALAISTTRGTSRVRAGLRGLRLAAYTGAVIAVALFRFGGHSYYRGILFTTLARSNSLTPAEVILDSSFQWVGMVIVIALVGAVMSLSAGPRTRLLCAALTSAALLAPLDQMHIHTLTSLHKHVVFGAWFAAIAAGYALDHVLQVNWAKTRIVVAAVLVFLALTGAMEASALDRQWPNAARMAAGMSRVVEPGDHNYLIEESSVAEYYLYPRLKPTDVNNTWYFAYRTPEGKNLTGMNAYRCAIQNHYFEAVELDYSLTRQTSKQIAAMLRQHGSYRLMESFTYSYAFGHSSFQIWRYEPRRHVRSALHSKAC
jgi:4-amino-4-deoxy-L-arabinose transferase-like glycosyltransferase